MSRTAVFRIIGIGFLAFAALGVYRGEFGANRTGTVVISRAHDPVDFWKAIIIQAGVGALCFIWAARREEAPFVPPPATIRRGKGKPRRNSLVFPTMIPRFAGRS